jgi:hypothetical protein
VKPAEEDEVGGVHHEVMILNKMGWQARKGAEEEALAQSVNQSVATMGCMHTGSIQHSFIH